MPKDFKIIKGKDTRSERKLIRELQQLGVREDHAKAIMTSGDPHRRRNLEEFTKALAEAHDHVDPVSGRK